MQVPLSQGFSDSQTNVTSVTPNHRGSDSADPLLWPRVRLDEGFRPQAAGAWLARARGLQEPPELLPLPL